MGLSMNLSPLYVYALCFLGSTIPATALQLLLKPVLDGLRKKKKSVADNFEKSFLEKFSHMGSDKHIFLKLLFFVGIPIPMTGAYTGSFLSVLLNVSPLKGFSAVTLGNALAGVIVLSIGSAFSEYADKILLGFLGIVPIVIIFNVIKRVVRKKKTNLNTKATE